MDFIKKNKLYICLAGCALIFVSLFFAFAKVSVAGWGTSLSKSVNYIDCDDGKIVLVAVIAAAALIWFKKEKLSLIPTAIILVVTLIDIIDAKDKFSGVSGTSVFGIKVNVGFGLSPWLIIIGVVLAAGPIVIDMLESKGIIKAKN